MSRKYSEVCSCVGGAHRSLSSRIRSVGGSADYMSTPVCLYYLLPMRKRKQLIGRTEVMDRISSTGRHNIVESINKGVRVFVRGDFCLCMI